MQYSYDKNWLMDGLGAQAFCSWCKSTGLVPQWTRPWSLWQLTTGLAPTTEGLWLGGMELMNWKYKAQGSRDLFITVIDLTFWIVTATTEWLVRHHIFILIWVDEKYLHLLILLFILPCFPLPSEAVGLLVMSLNDWFLVSLDEWPTLRASWCWCKSSGRVPQLMRPFLSQISMWVEVLTN